MLHLQGVGVTRGVAVTPTCDATREREDAKDLCHNLGVNARLGLYLSSRHRTTRHRQEDRVEVGRLRLHYAASSSKCANLTCSDAIATAVVADATARERREEAAQRRREEGWRAVMRHPLSVAVVEPRR